MEMGLQGTTISNLLVGYNATDEVSINQLGCTTAKDQCTPVIMIDVDVDVVK